MQVFLKKITGPGVPDTPSFIQQIGKQRTKSPSAPGQSPLGSSTPLRRVTTPKNVKSNMPIVPTKPKTFTAPGSPKVKDVPLT